MRVHLSLIATRNTPSMTKSTPTAAKEAIAVMESIAEKDCFYSLRIASSFFGFCQCWNDSTLAYTSTHSA